MATAACAFTSKPYRTTRPDRLAVLSIINIPASVVKFFAMKKRRDEAKPGTASHLDDVEKQIINFWSDQATYLQSSRNAIAVAARLGLGGGEPLTIEQLSNDLGIARSSLTNAVREGMAKGFIKSVRVMGKRKEYFTGRSTDP